MNHHASVQDYAKRKRTQREFYANNRVNLHYEGKKNKTPVRPGRIIKIQMLNEKCNYSYAGLLYSPVFRVFALIIA